MDISTRRFVAANGERTAVLVDGAGMPLYYPNLFATWHLRSRSLAANSIFNSLNVIKALYAWQEHVGIDVEARFSRSELLQENEARGLSDFLQLALGSESRGKKVVNIRRKPRTVGTSNHYFRMTVVANYLEFLAARLCPAGQNDKDKVKDRKMMVGMIKANRPSKPNRCKRPPNTPSELQH